MKPLEKNTIQLGNGGGQDFLNYDSKSRTKRKKQMNLVLQKKKKKILAWQKTNNTQRKCICDLHHKELMPQHAEKS